MELVVWFVVVLRGNSYYLVDLNEVAKLSFLFIYNVYEIASIPSKSFWLMSICSIKTFFTDILIPSSFKLTPFDYYHWDYGKSQEYKNNPQSIADEIIHVFCKIKTQIVKILLKIITEKFLEVLKVFMSQIQFTFYKHYKKKMK